MAACDSGWDVIAPKVVVVVVVVMAITIIVIYFDSFPNKHE